VSEVILGYDPHVKRYVRFERDLGGKKDTVIDVTAAAIKDGRDVSYEWTEVMLLGNSDNQDTTQKLFAIGSDSEKAYIANTLYRRFYRLSLRSCNLVWGYLIVGAKGICRSGR